MLTAEERSKLLPDERITDDATPDVSVPGPKTGEDYMSYEFFKLVNREFFKSVIQGLGWGLGLILSVALGLLLLYIVVDPVPHHPSGKDFVLFILNILR